MTSCKCVTHFEVVQREFPRMGNVGPGANQHENMSCFDGNLVLVLVSQKLHPTKHEP